MGEANNIENPDFQIDEAKIRRGSVMSGAWAGIKKGLFWGGITTAVLGAGALAFGGPALLSAGKGTLGLVASFPVIGKPIAALGAVILGGGALQAVSGGIGDVAWKLLTLGLEAFATVGLPIMIAGAVIGGVMGAVKGYEQADEKVDAAKRKARQNQREFALEQKQTLSAQQQLETTKEQLAAQTKELDGTGSSQIGQFTPGFTPESSKDNGLGDKAGPQYS